MNNNEIEQLMENGKFDEAQIKIEELISNEPIKKVEEEKYTHYCFNNYIELLLFYNFYKLNKQNIVTKTNMAELYYKLGYISIEKKDYKKAIEYLNEGIKWNPVDMKLLFERAAAYRYMGDLERFKAEIEKIHKFIYNSAYLSKYFRELGWYYAERRIFDVANALYTNSMNFLNTSIAVNELHYIAEQENREFKFSTLEEIKKLFTDYNIPIDFNQQTTKMIFDEYQMLKDKNPKEPVIDTLSLTLYDITLKKEFMVYSNIKDNELGIEIKIPKSWHYLSKEAYKKFNISDEVVFLLILPDDRKINILNKGKCEKEDFDRIYNKNLDIMKKQGISIISEHSIKEPKNIKQVFVEEQANNQIVRTIHNYIVENGYLLDITWIVSKNRSVEEELRKINGSFEMEVILSIKENQENRNEAEYKNFENKKHNVDVNSITIKCSKCDKNFQLKWKVPTTEAVFYCKCPNCGAELKCNNPNYKN